MVLLVSCTQETKYEKLIDGIVVHLNADGKSSHLKLQVMCDKINVTVAPADTFSTFKSLTVLDIKYIGGKVI